MSSKIDERVVGMKFNSAQFEKGVSDTSSALDKLKSKLNLDASKKSLEGLSDAGKKFSLANIGDSVENISSKFSALGIIGVGALATIGAKAVSVGLQIAQNLGRSIRDGFAEYETNINSIQTIMANTSMKGTTLDNVNAALEQLNAYSDRTIYNFSEMARNIGTFTAAGVDLDTSVNAIKGIANLAALSGSNSQQASTAMYQLSQALSTGTVKLMDWNSVVNAGMGGEVFQNALKETARNHGIAVDSIIEKNGSFRDSLTEGWLTTEVLTETLSKLTGDLSDEQLIALGYTQDQVVEIQKLAALASGAATDIKTFSQLLGTIAETSGSGWSKTFQIIFGDFEEAKALWTEVNNVIGPMQEASAQARNDFLQGWKDAGGRTAVIDALRNSFQALMAIVTPIKEAFREVFPPGGPELLIKLSFALKDFTSKLILSEDAQANLKTVAVALFSVLKFGFDILGGIASILAGTIGLLLRFAVAMGSLIGPTITFFSGLMKGADDAEGGVSKVFTVFNNLREQVLGPMIETIHLLGDAWNEFLNGDATKFAGKVKAAFEPMAGLGERIMANWSVVSGFLKSAWEFAKPLAEAIGNIVKGISEGFRNIAKDIDLNTVLAAVNTGFLAMIALSFKKYIDLGADFVKSLTGMFEGVTGVLSAMQTKLKAEALTKIAIAIGILAVSLLALSMINPDNLGTAVAAMGGLIVGLVGALAALDKVASSPAVAKMPMLTASLILLSTAVLILAHAMVMMSEVGWDGLLVGLTGLAGAMGLLAGVAVVLGKVEKDLMQGAKAMVVVSVAVLILASAMKIFASMSWEELAKAGSALAVGLGLIVGALVLLSLRQEQIQGAAAAILLVSISIGVLAGAIAILGVLPIPVLVQGLIALALVLAMLAGAILLLSINNAATMAAAVSMLAMAVAINILVGAIAILGSLSMETLVQGLVALAVTMGLLVGAMYLMTGALPGAAATLVVAAAIMVLALAIGTLGAMDLGTLIQGLVGLVAVFLVLAVAGLLLGPLTPVLLGLGAALALVGLGVLAMAAAMVVFSIGLAMFGPAATMAAGGLKTLSAAMAETGEHVPTFLAVGAGLLLFGAGAAVAGAGILILAAGLVLLGAGLALVGAVGLIGVTALLAVVDGMMKLLPETLKMGLLGAAFLVLGAGLVVLGAGALLAGAGLILVGTGFLLVAAASIAGSAAMVVLGKAVDKLAPKVGKMEELAGAIKKMASALTTAGSSALTASFGLITIVAAALAISASLNALKASATSLAPPITSSTKQVTAAFSAMSKESVVSLTALRTGLLTTIPGITAAATQMAARMTSGVVGQIRASRGSMDGAGAEVGNAIVQGMTRGLNNGSYLVTNAARGVAQRALQASKNALGVASPSKEYEQVGMWSDKGLANGLVKHSDMVERAGTAVGMVALAAIKESVANIAQAVDADIDIQPTIRPVLDLTDVKKEASNLGSLLGGASLPIDGNYASASSIAADNRARREEDDDDTPPTEGARSFTFIQNNTSPKALPPAELYRNTKNEISRVKEALDAK